MATVPTLPAVTGGTYTTSQISATIAVSSFLLKPPTAELRQSVAQSLANGTWTALTFDVEDVDSDIDGIGGHSTSSNTSRFTARFAGVYECGGGTAFGVNATGNRGTHWVVNGVDINASSVLLAAIATLPGCFPARSKHIYLASSDYLELFAFQSSGGALSTSGTTIEQANAKIKWVSS